MAAESIELLGLAGLSADSRVIEFGERLGDRAKEVNW
jgi:hypothetical protein